MKKKGMWITIILLVIVGLIGTIFVATSRAGYETAAYEVIEKQGRFELRQYAPHEVVVTSMKSGQQNGSFGKLFQYISGRNEGEQKIAMTTPVFMPATAEGKMEEMQFVVPVDVSATGAPSPSNEAVQVRKKPGGKFAVIRYSGNGRGELRLKKLEELRAEILNRGLSEKDDPVFAGYDPPWTPGFLRRNEVLIRVE